MGFLDEYIHTRFGECGKPPFPDSPRLARAGFHPRLREGRFRKP